MLRAGWNHFKNNTLSLFHRPGTNLAPIDGIRALSQLAVMLYHCFFLLRMVGDPEQFRQIVQQTPWFLGWVWTLDYSVDAFFVLSGYLIAALLLREHSRTGRLDFKRFYWRRYLRLTPAYFAFILLFMVLSPRLHPSIWANFLYVNNLITLQDMAIPWTWSLAVEEQFYLVFPALLVCLVLPGRHQLFKLSLLWLFSIAMAALTYLSDDLLRQSTHQDVFFDDGVFNRYYDHFYVNLHSRFGPFVCGAILAQALHQHSDKLAGIRAKPWLYNGLNILALLILVRAGAFNPYTGEPSLGASQWHLIVDRNLFGAALAWVIFATLGNAGVLTPLKHFLSWKVWYPIAQLSYSMYLFHYVVVIFVITNLLGNLRYFGLLSPDTAFPYLWLLPAYLAVVVLTVIPALLLFSTVEKPFILLRDKLGRKPASATIAVQIAR